MPRNRLRHVGARLDVPLDAVDVEVEADYDTRGELGVADEFTPGYTQIRYRVTVISPAPEADVLRVLDTADRYSPYRDVFGRAQPMTRDVEIKKS